MVNNWFVIMNGVKAASRWGVWARVYFIAYWVVAVLAVMNLVVAFVLDAFFEALSSPQRNAEHMDEAQLPHERGQQRKPEPEPEIIPMLEHHQELHHRGATLPTMGEEPLQ